MKILSASTRSFRLTSALLSCAALLLGTAAVSQAADSPQPGDLRLFYHENCARCHGAEGTGHDSTGKGLRGQDFTDVKWRKDTTDDKMVAVILKGKFFGLAMPAYKSKLTKEDAQRMVTDIIRVSEKGKLIQPPRK
jgi:mono/diheme cytochrome c family protein